MAKISYISVLLIVFSFQKVHAQIMKEWGWDQIDTAYIACDYKYVHPNPLGDMSVEENMTLEVGKRLSKFYSYDSFKYDSLRSTPEGRLMVRRKVQEAFRNSAKETTKEGQRKALSSMPSRKSECIIYKNYSEPGTMLVQDAVDGNYFKYAEKDFLKSQSWEMVQDTLTIMGYPCQKATCTWRGRRYTAWFSPMLPISDGPYKFCGLPGLILKVKDDSGLYSFEIQGIRKTDGIGIYLAKPLKNGEYKEGERTQVIKSQAESMKKRVRAINRNMQRIGSENRVSDKDIDTLEKDY